MKLEMVIGIEIEIFDSQGSGLFSNEPFVKQTCSGHFNVHFDKHFESQFLGNGLFRTLLCCNSGLVSITKKYAYSVTSVKIG